MKYYLTQEEMEKVEKLANYALSARNKQDANKYIQQMRFAINDVWGSSKNMLNEMVAAVSDATGQVADKAHRVSIANQLIIKAKMNCVEKK